MITYFVIYYTSVNLEYSCHLNLNYHQILIFICKKPHSNNMEFNLDATNTGHPLDFNYIKLFSLPRQQYLKRYNFAQSARLVHVDDVAENLEVYIPGVYCIKYILQNYIFTDL